MISFKEYVKRVDEGQTALHLLPPAGDTRKVLKGKSDFDAHIAANAAGSKKQRGADGRTYHIKNGRVHGVWNSEAGTGVAYTSSKNESEELDESGWVSGISKWKEAVNAKHGHALPTFKKVAQPGSPGKSTTYARSSQTGNIIGVYQHHNKSGTVHESVELDEIASTEKLPIKSVHKHVQEFMGMGTSLKLADHMRTGTAKHTSWEKVNSGLTAIGVKPQHIAILANRIRPAQYEQEELDEAEGLTTKKNQNGGHDVYHNGTHIGHVEQKSMPWLRGKTIKKVFAKKPNGDSVVVDSDDMGKNTIESAKKTLLKHHLAESEEISEDNPYMWKIEGGKGKGKEFAHKSTTVDDHLSAMSYHSTEYQKAMKEKRDSDARHHGMKYHKHKDQIERLGNSGSYLKDSVELDEATFVSDSPATYGSRGTKFDVKKNKEKSTGEHANGQPKEHHDVYHEGKHVGHVASYSGYKDKKAPGARIVSSRKNVRLWQATVHGGEHNRHGSVFNTTPAGSQYTGTGFASKKDALQHFADAHNSNKSR